MAQTGTDVIVAGGGTAGSVVAGRLVEAGLRVVVLEAGPDYGPSDSGHWPEDLRVATASLPEGHDWGYTGRGAGDQDLAFERARVIGGCSSHNGCGLGVGWRGDYDRWAASGCDGWSGEDLTPFFSSAIERLRVRHFERQEVQPFLRAYLDAAVAAGIPETDDIGDLDGEVGCGPELMNIVDGVRWNAAFGYLDPVRDRAELEVIGEALVDRVLFQDGRATGVRAIVGDEVREYHADLVILSGGAYGSPEVLLRSGIGPADELGAVGVRPLIDLPGVGANLHDQPAIELTFDATDRLVEATSEFEKELGWLPEEQVMAKIASPGSIGPYDLHVYPWMERDARRSSGWLVVVATSLLTPRSRGTVRLRSADPFERGVPNHRFLTEEDDVRDLLTGVRTASELVKSDALAPYLGAPVQLPPESSNDASLIDWITRTHAHYWHPAGTCRMGPSTDPTAVVDADGRVGGVEGLRVADASIFPEIPRSTPTLPVVMIGERIADGILRPS